MKAHYLLILFSVSWALSAEAIAKERLIGPADRPARIKIPRQVSQDARYPLIVGLHGVGSNSRQLDLHLRLGAGLNRFRYLLVLPEGTVRSDGRRFWNATSYCCDADKTGVDDSGYISDLVREAIERYPVDRSRVYVMGFSNGGYMAHRLACDNDGLFTGAVSIAGAMDDDSSNCAARVPIRFLQIHGTKDETVLYKGRPGKYPSAIESTEFWADRNGCKTRVERRRAYNLILLPLNGKFLSMGLKPETDETRFTDCDSGDEAALWSIQEAPHVPVFFGRDLLGRIMDFLF